jgi:hypothetical protein
VCPFVSENAEGVGWLDAGKGEDIVAYGELNVYMDYVGRGDKSYLGIPCGDEMVTVGRSAFPTRYVIVGVPDC